MSEEINISNLSEDSGNEEQVDLTKEEVLSRKYFLKGKMIGISISESDNLEELGFSITHLKDAMIEVARYIIASGGKIAYGGDMRQGGFTELMFDLLAYYQADKELPPHERFFSYLAYPLSVTLSSEKEAELRQNVSFKKVLPPPDVAITNINEFLKPNSPENLYIWTRCLTKMREEMESDCQARIFIGGRTKGYKGKCPGILEELLIALRHKHPVYLVGAFGGVTKSAIDALNNMSSENFIDDFHLENSEYKQMVSLYNERHPEGEINYAQFYSTIQDTGFSEISRMNGLTETENLRLANTPHISEIVFLIIKGLTNCLIS